MPTQDEILAQYFEAENQSIDMSSRNHAKAQSNLVFALMKKYNDKYHIFSQVSVQLEKQTTIPDVCAYLKKNFDWSEDELHLNEPPEIVFEIISPQQGTQELVLKFKTYFKAGVKSCWLLNPLNRSVFIYNPQFEQQGFLSGNIQDTQANIALELDEIFTL